ncbi:hypothetical protein FKM82_000489 [Ascaphus truei]
MCLNQVPKKLTRTTQRNSCTMLLYFFLIIYIQHILFTGGKMSASPKKMSIEKDCTFGRRAKKFELLYFS